MLRVEGKDDVHVLRHLLHRHSFNCDSLGVSIKDPGGDGDETNGGKELLLAGIPTEVKASTGRSVGFVLDADEVPMDCWRAVRYRLAEVGMKLPNEIPEAGFVGEATHFQARVGVWLMPDNRFTGALEEFLQGLVDDNDLLLPIAEESTHRAKAEGALFPESSRRKAVLHAWLAWQERPGLPYGSAIRARYFGHDSPAAVAFVDRFKRLFTGDAGRNRQ